MAAFAAKIVSNHIYNVPVQSFDSKCHIRWNKADSKILENYLASWNLPDENAIPSSVTELMPVIRSLGFAHHEDAQNDKGDSIFKILCPKIVRRLKTLYKILGMKNENENEQLPVSRKRGRSLPLPDSATWVAKVAKTHHDASPEALLAALPDQFFDNFDFDSRDSPSLAGTTWMENAAVCPGLGYQMPANTYPSLEIPATSMATWMGSPPPATPKLSFATMSTETAPPAGVTSAWPATNLPIRKGNAELPLADPWPMWCSSSLPPQMQFSPTFAQVSSGSMAAVTEPPLMPCYHPFSQANTSSLALCSNLLSVPSSFTAGSFSSIESHTSTEQWLRTFGPYYKKYKDSQAQMKEYHDETNYQIDLWKRGIGLDSDDASPSPASPSLSGTALHKNSSSQELSPCSSASQVAACNCHMHQKQQKAEDTLPSLEPEAPAPAVASSSQSLPPCHDDAMAVADDARAVSPSQISFSFGEDEAVLSPRPVIPAQRLSFMQTFDNKHVLIPAEEDVFSGRGSLGSLSPSSCSDLSSLFWGV